MVGLRKVCQGSSREAAVRLQSAARRIRCEAEGEVGYTDPHETPREKRLLGQLVEKAGVACVLHANADASCAALAALGVLYGTRYS